MDWTLLTIQILEFLKNIGGSWGMAIILLTIVVRLIMIPLSVSQQRSMKKMQELSPRLKQLQAKYKDDPQKLQQKMMEFYKDNKFNPLGGCFPLLLQMPVFILLYTTLISPIFLQLAGPESFLFVNRLDGTLQTYAGQADDGTFNVKEKDTFITGKYNVMVTIKGSEKETKGLIEDYQHALQFEPKPLVPGEVVNFSLAPDKISFPDNKSIKPDQILSAYIPVLDNNSKEIEHIKFKRKGDILEGSTKTLQGKSSINLGVLLLLLLFAVTMYGSQKITMSMSSSAAMDPQQKAMQETMSKMMPIMILVMFVIIPIPAGVLLYMVVSNIFQVGQTVAINKYLDIEKATKKASTDKSTEIIDAKCEVKQESPVKRDCEETKSTQTKASSQSKMSRRQRKKKKNR